MTVKDRVGRPRYVAFHVEGATLGRGAVAGQLPEWAKLTRFDGSWGIVRAPHTRAVELRTILEGVKRVGGQDVRLRPLATSGTLKGAAARLPPEATARERGPRPPGA